METSQTINQIQLVDVTDELRPMARIAKSPFRKSRYSFIINAALTLPEGKKLRVELPGEWTARSAQCTVRERLQEAGALVATSRKGKVLEVRVIRKPSEKHS